MKAKSYSSSLELKNVKVEEWKSEIDDDPDLYELIKSLPPENLRVFNKTIILNPFIPIIPFYNQVKLLVSAWESEDCLYGGGRGGGKTDAFLMGATQFVQFPEWKAGILRLTYKHLSKLGAVMNRAKKWFTLKHIINEGIAPHWNRDTTTWEFLSGAGILFGHVQHDDDVDAYQGAELHRLLIEEAVQFSTHKITHLKGSVRKAEGDVLPVNIWYNGNPGGLSHDYFNNKFVKGKGLFIPSLFKDNKYLNQIKYKKFLSGIAEENPILGRQWEHGDWDAVPKGKMFKRTWFNKTYTLLPERIIKRVRLWDLAATDPEDPTNKNPDPDYTAGALLLVGESGRAYLQNMRQYQLAPDESEEEIFKQAEEDTRAVKLRIELEGGASPQYLINDWSKRLPGYDFEGWTIPKKSKMIRAQAMVSFIKNGNLWLYEDPEWNDNFLAEITSFPTKKVHDDQVDALSGAFAVAFNLEMKDYNNLEDPDWDEFAELNEY